MADETVIPTPSLVVLIGPSGSGKTTWADANFAPGQVLSTDRFRALVGAGPEDQTAGTEAFELLHQLLAVRLAKGLTTVVDTLGLDADQRAGYRAVASNAGMACVVVGFDTAAAECHRRNGQRRRPLPKAVLDKQLRQWRKTRAGLEGEGFDRVIIDPDPARQVPTTVLTTPREKPDPATERTTGLAFDLVVSDFAFDGGAGDIEPALVAMARAAEATGFRALWVMDHFRQVPQIGRAWDPMLESYTTLAYLAAKTERLRLGTLVTGVEHRNVGLLAKIIATLDVLSGGRAECGLGAGWFSAEQAAYGYAVNPDRIRLDTLEDALQALPVLWGPGSKPFEGAVLSVPEALAYPRPIQDPLPILVGGGGERRTLRLAARYAQACNFLAPPRADQADLVQHKIEVLRRHCADVGRDPDEVAVTILCPLVHAPDGRSLAELVDSMRPANQPAEQFASATGAATTDEYVERFGRLAELGVERVCVALTGNDGPDRVEWFGEVIDAVT